MQILLDAQWLFLITHAHSRTRKILEDLSLSLVPSSKSFIPLGGRAQASPPSLRKLEGLLSGVALWEALSRLCRHRVTLLSPARFAFFSFVTAFERNSVNILSICTVYVDHSHLP